LRGVGTIAILIGEVDFPASISSPPAVLVGDG
jgi:hypothetical protein